jgi:succinate dehydrogenase / fumarate reductase flavoprotein subunit
MPDDDAPDEASDEAAGRDPGYEIHEHDILVVGAGGAGLRAAVEASDEDTDVAVVMKSLLGKAHTVMAEGGIASALGNADARDNWKVHFRDTMRGSKFLANIEMAKIHAKESPDRVRELEQWGAVFDRTEDGWINQRPFGGHAYPRLAHVGDRTGLEMIRTLQDHGTHAGLDFFMETVVTDLFKDGDRVSGALAYERETGQFHLFRAKAVVLATGGFGKIYRITSNSWEYTGDGHYLAYEAGADLIDMEFVQFHPTGMVWPPSVRGTLVTEGVRGEGGHLRNSEGKRFMFDNIPDLYEEDTADTEEEADRWVEGDESARRPPELLTRDVVAKAIMDEVEAGRGSPHDGAYLDISWRSDEYIERKLPSMVHQFEELAQVDIREEPMEVYPTCHYAMGGVRVDAETQESTVPGLFACGEVAGGLHGANRLGGNSLSDLLVFGARAGEGAKEYVQELDELPSIDEDEVGEALDEALDPLARTDGENPYAIHEDLQTIMHEHANMIRTEEELTEGLEKLDALEERYEDVSADGPRSYNPGWHRAIALRSMFTVARMVARAARMREESRGAHLRDDHLEKDDEEWGDVNIVIRKGDDGEMELTTEPIPVWPEELEAILERDAEELASAPTEVTA